MRQLIETDEGNLAPLPVVLRILMLKVSKLQLRAAFEFPLQRCLDWPAADERVQLTAFIPEAAFIPDLDGIAAEYDRAKLGIRNMPQRLQKQRPRFTLTAPSGPAV